MIITFPEHPHEWVFAAELKQDVDEEGRFGPPGKAYSWWAVVRNWVIGEGEEQHPHAHPFCRWCGVPAPDVEG